VGEIEGGRKRILVTGGAGFLASHLIDRLVGLGHEALCVDDLFTGSKRNIDTFTAIRPSGRFRSPRPSSRSSAA
jgi:nucleoside-diphosphate-sugar epimerase